MIYLRQKFAIALLGIFFVSSVALPAGAATVKKPAYAGTIVTQSTTSLKLKPGETVTYKLSVKNTGTATWNAHGSRYVSIYTYFPKYRTSVFADKSWFKKIQPATINENTVKPGAVATLDFKLTAPAKIGTYEEGFYMAVENVSWISGTQIKIPITVAAPVAVTPPSTKPTAPVPVIPPVVANPSPSGPLSAQMIIKSFQDRVTVAGGASVKVSVGFKNIGTSVWQTRVLRLRSLNIADSSSPVVSLADSTWPNAQEPSRVREPISPGNIGFFDFKILGPVKRGEYTLPLKLVIDDKEVPGATVDIPITVTEDAPQLPQQEIPIVVGAGEPLIRVGLWNVPGDVVLLNSSAFTVVGSSGVAIASIPAGQVITAHFDRSNKTVTVNTPNGNFASAVPVRFVPSDPVGLFQVPGFAGWTTSLYTNQFRGTMEINYYRPNDNVWLIEELPLEQYLRGIAETGNDSSYEFKKALIVAARNYAYFVHSIGGKYELFDVQTGAADQVYRAYGSETIRPNLVRAVEETRGQMVTYGEEIVVTPYFSRSDGRTRAWTEVWGGKYKPWLVSVAAPHDTGKSLWGHGVGMSAEDALGWAVDGKTYDWILKYFYTGTTLKKIY